MTEIYLTPTEGGQVVNLSRTMFRKKILPLGTINYKGRKIEFDQAYLTDLASSFQDGAFDQVPFMLADKDNAHTMDPERYRGDIRGVEVAEDGLYGTFELSGDAADLVKKNPNLGVSARIVEGYDRADGKTYPRAMQHVLGTLDPRITGLGAWQEVSLSGYDSGTQIVNLTESTYEGDPMTKKPDELDLGGLTDEELAELLASLEDEDDGDETEEDEDVPDEPAAKKTPQPVGLAADHPIAIELANQRTETSRIKAELALSRFDNEREKMIRDGVPPFLIDLAKPIMLAADPVVLDLSNGLTDDNKSVDAGAIVREILRKSAGVLELASERGHGSTRTEDADEDDITKKQLDLWADQFGS